MQGTPDSRLGVGGIPLFGLYGYVQLDRVWYVLNKVYFVWLVSVLNRVRTCPKEGIVIRAEGLQVNLDCAQSLSFRSLREVRLKEHAIERQTTSGAFLFLICIISTELKRLLPDHFLDKNALLSVSFNLNYFSTYQYYNKCALAERIIPVGLVSLPWIKWW